MMANPLAGLLAAATSYGGSLPFAAMEPRPEWPSGHYKGKARGRHSTAEDEKAFRKRVAKRRAKKGYR